MAKTLTSTPRADGLRMPGEFEPHAGTWMLWPERPDNWRQGGKPAQRAFAEVAAAIARFEPVTMGVSAGQYAHARAALPPGVRVVELSSDDAWMRDCGPTFVVGAGGIVRGVDWEFNAWGGLSGGLYFPWDRDAQVAQKVLELAGVDRYQPGLVLEGGSIHVDGEGTLFTTEECLLNPNRNPQYTRAQIETRLRETLNVETIIWLGQGVYLDETDGHVDNLINLVAPGVVALTWSDDRADPQYEISRDAYERLSRAVDARGRRLEIHKLHQPGPVYITAAEAQDVDPVAGTLPRTAGARLAGSYANYYTCNGAVIVPVFNDPHDAAAVETLRRLYPRRAIIPIPAREILLGGGNIHCITQQEPKIP